MNWDDPAARAALIERVGPKEYERLQQEHFRESAVADVNGYRIRPVQTRFGRLFLIHEKGDAYRSLDDAKAAAAKLPKRETTDAAS
jgi:hypothetical protein